MVRLINAIKGLVDDGLNVTSVRRVGKNENQMGMGKLFFYRDVERGACNRKKTKEKYVWEQT